MVTIHRTIDHKNDRGLLRCCWARQSHVRRPKRRVTMVAPVTGNGYPTRVTGPQSFGHICKKSGKKRVVERRDGEWSADDACLHDPLPRSPR
ncbi:hypothetical protein J6590_066458 [Homalodisca vitripennis]|nr:hypothetical protein J6590_066458 [Homalodisca vitripennis]